MAEHICTAEKLKYKRRDGSLGALRALTPGSGRRGSCALETSSRMFIGTIRELKSGIPRARRIRDYGGRDERCASETPREDSPGKGEQIKLEITYIRLNYHSPTFPLSLFRSFSCTALTAQQSYLTVGFVFPTLHVVCIHHLSGKKQTHFHKGYTWLHTTIALEASPTHHLLLRGQRCHPTYHSLFQCGSPMNPACWAQRSPAEL